jgi:hypothetical protein
VLQALAEGWSPEAFANALRRQQERRSHH